MGEGRVLTHQSRCMPCSAVIVLTPCSTVLARIGMSPHTRKGVVVFNSCLLLARVRLALCTPRLTYCLLLPRVCLAHCTPHLHTPSTHYIRRGNAPGYSDDEVAQALEELKQLTLSNSPAGTGTHTRRKAACFVTLSQKRLNVGRAPLSVLCSTVWCTPYCKNSTHPYRRDVHTSAHRVGCIPDGEACFLLCVCVCVPTQ